MRTGRKGYRGSTHGGDRRGYRLAEGSRAGLGPCTPWSRLDRPSLTKFSRVRQSPSQRRDRSVQYETGRGRHDTPRLQHDL